MKHPHTLPDVFARLRDMGVLSDADVVATEDGFWALRRPLSDLLAVKGINDFPDSTGEWLACDLFFDDWYLYAVDNGYSRVYSLFKLREQEHDAEYDTPADGDTPGVTVSFIAFRPEALTDCLTDPTAGKRGALSEEIHRVVAYAGQAHHKALKAYFINPNAQGSYLIAALYLRHLAAYAENGRLEVPQRYRELRQQSLSYKNNAKYARLPRFINELNRQVGRTVCDHEYLYIPDADHLDDAVCAALLATHTGNVSVHSFAAEVEYHARFLFPLAKVRIPFFGRSVYASAIRADMTIDDTEFEGPAPFYRLNSSIVKRQQRRHPQWPFLRPEAPRD